MKIVINKCYGGFGLSNEAYDKLIEWGVPVQAYIKQQRDPETKLYLDEPLNDGEVIFDRRLDEPESINHAMTRLTNAPYWDCWTRQNRTHPLVIRVVETLGEEASSGSASLEIVTIPDGIEYEIKEYDGIEWVAESHRTWS